jgi:hypothetical protein
MTSASSRWGLRLVRDSGTDSGAKVIARGYRISNVATIRETCRRPGVDVRRRKCAAVIKRPERFDYRVGDDVHPDGGQKYGRADGVRPKQDGGAHRSSRRE